MAAVASFNCGFKLRAERTVRTSAHAADDTLSNSEPSVLLQQGKARLFQSGNPIIFGGAVKEVFGEPGVAEMVLAKDHRGNVFAKGFFNPFSQYRVRVMALRSDPVFESSPEDIIDARIKAAVLMRASLQLPSADTTAYRLINGEGDQLGGLVVDVLGSTIVAQSSAYWAESFKEAITRALQKHVVISAAAVATAVRGHKRVVWRRAEARLKQDGFPIEKLESEAEEASNSKLTATVAVAAAAADLVAARPATGSDNVSSSTTATSTSSADSVVESKLRSRLLQRRSGSISSSSSSEGIPSTSVVQQQTATSSSIVDSRAVDESIGAGYLTVIENGISYHLEPESGQKTGFYCDQRDSRLLIRALADGKSVLDAYCYTGGFSLNAAAGGATVVLAVDSSERALATAAANCELNAASVGACVMDFIQGDAVAVMQRLQTEQREFDIVICDPPKLAPTRNSLAKATAKYQRINTEAMRLVNRSTGGLLLTCSCSAAMTQSGKFLDMLAAAARDAKREIKVVSQMGAAMDHPVLVAYPEGRYLTAVLLHVT